MFLREEDQGLSRSGFIGWISVAEIPTNVIVIYVSVSEWNSPLVACEQAQHQEEFSGKGQRIKSAM